MKKLLLVAASAALVLGGCVKSETVYTGAQQEIGFNVAALKNTKAPISGTTLSGSGVALGVYATYNDAETYFKNGRFAEDGATNIFLGNPTKYYWPKSGTLKFVGYAPYQASGVSDTGSAGSITSIAVEVTGNETAQNDVLYSNLTGAVSANNVAMTFQHALSQIVFKAKANVADIVTITGITLKDAQYNGTLTITPAAASTIAWTDLSIAEDKAVALGTMTTTLPTEPAGTTTGVLVVPTAPTTVYVTYKIAGLETVFNANLGLTLGGGNWVAGKKYVYTISVSLTEIKIEPSVTDWEDVNVSPDINI